MHGPYDKSPEGEPNIYRSFNMKLIALPLLLAIALIGYVVSHTGVIKWMADGVQAEFIDLLTLSPLDDEQFTASARKTGHVVIVHEACRSFGPGAEIVARLVEKAFFYLEAPIRPTGHLRFQARIFLRSGYEAEPSPSRTIPAT